MEVEAGLISFVDKNYSLVVFVCVRPAKLIKLDQKKLNSGNFWWKGWILKHLAKISAKKIKSQQSTIVVCLKNENEQYYC